MRRTRIKGVANIPQRKKNETPQKAEKDDGKQIDRTVPDVKIETSPETQLNTSCNDEKPFDEPVLNSHHSVTAEEVNELKVETQNITKKQKFAILGNVLLSNTLDIKQDVTLNSKEVTEKKSVPLRRKAYKPSVSVHAINKKVNRSEITAQNEEIKNQNNTEKVSLDIENNIEEKYTQEISSNIPSASVYAIGNDDGDVKKEIIEHPTNSRETDCDLDGQCSQKSEEKIDGSKAENTQKKVKMESSFRRRPIKPTISVQAIGKKDEKIKTDTVASECSTEMISPRVEKEAPNISGKLEIIESSSQKFSSPLNTTNNQEINQSSSQLNNTSDVGRIASPYPGTESESECSIIQSSPNKMNRGRIKAIPKLGMRKITFNSSESEEVQKKSDSRVRNDSQSSNISTNNEPEMTVSKVKEFSSAVKRKAKRTEWSRKLDDARREFSRKFMSEKPDHKKLTMIDLIFYNPTTNTIKKDRKNSESESNNQHTERNEEDVDDPLEAEPQEVTENQEESTRVSDDESEIPAPQIKIGPSGEIILDEKSLVIENKQVTKDREELQKSQVVDGNLDRPYGVYNRVKRSKDWFHSDTLRFYKALSTIGTDFSLMCDLFPTRTRRELKMKFKKEEKINPSLIDKCLMQPCSFDFEELKKEFELVEIEKQVLEEQKKKDDKLKKNKKIRKSIKFINLTQENDSPQSTEETLNKKPPELETENISQINNVTVEKVQVEKRHKRCRVPKFAKKIKKKKLDITSVLSDTDCGNTDSDESEILSRPTQTRYGRKIRKRQVYEGDDFSSEDMKISRKIGKSARVAKPDSHQKPGSIMMLSSKNADGEPIVQIFMVTDKKTPNTDRFNNLENQVNILPIATIKTGQTDDDESEKEEEIIEYNYTIAADDTKEMTENSTEENVIE